MSFYFGQIESCKIKLHDRKHYLNICFFVMLWATLPSSRDPLHPSIFVVELITVTFTSPLHLINSLELFLGRCNRGRGARYWAVCVLLADSSCVMFRIWTSFGSFALVWRSADLKLQALPP